jgi:hypothetical protein
MSKSFHHNSNIIIGDHVRYQMETKLGNNVVFDTNNGFNFTKPIVCDVFLIEDYKIFKHNSKLVIQKKTDGTFNTLLTIE